MKGEKYKEWLPKRLPNKMVIQTILYKSYSYMVKKEIGMRVFFHTLASFCTGIEAVNGAVRARE